MSPEKVIERAQDSWEEDPVEVGVVVVAVVVEEHGQSFGFHSKVSRLLLLKQIKLSIQLQHQSLTVVDKRHGMSWTSKVCHIRISMSILYRSVEHCR